MSGDDVQHNNAWLALQQFTNARIGIGRAGNSIPMGQSLQFKLAHAHARDAVYSKLDIEKLTDEAAQFNLPVLHVHSKAGYREQYLQRPDLGRQLSPTSAELLSRDNTVEYDIALIIADGLSATAVNEHSIGLLTHLLPMLTNAGLKPAPICLAEQGRVALADDIGHLLKARIALILIGERPGLSSADSMGAYLTYKPQPGLTDEARNCISNIRPDGLPLKPAAAKIFYLVEQSLQRGLSGVKLKDESDGGYFP